MKPVIVVGAGGHARVMIDLLRQCGADIIGLTDVAADVQGTEVMGVSVLGGDELVFRHDPSEIYLVCGLGGVKGNSIRHGVVQRFREKNYQFPVLVHPAAYVGSGVELGSGAQVLARAIIQTGARLMESVIVNTASVVEHDCIVGNHVHIATGAILAGGVRIGDGSHIGAGATILQGIAIGRDCVIGAGAAVIRDVPDGAVAVGVPARVIKYR